MIRNLFGIFYQAALESQFESLVDVIELPIDPCVCPLYFFAY